MLDPRRSEEADLDSVIFCIYSGSEIDIPLVFKSTIFLVADLANKIEIEAK